MTTINNYNLRIVELIEKEFDDNSIARNIYNEYGIRLSATIIKSKRDKKFIRTVKVTISEEIKNYTDSIIEALQEENNTAKSSKEISSLISSKKGIRLTKSEVNKLIFRYLKNKINYDNKNYVYTLKEPIAELDFEEKKDINLNLLIGKTENCEVAEICQNIFKEKYLNIKTGNEKMDYLIKSIVKDNAITKCEEIFLKQKAQEMGLHNDIIDQAKKSLYSNNPYLDNLIHIIYDDGIVTTEELNFLKEKSNEHNFSKTFVNQRFWTTGISVYLFHLLKISNFDKIVILIFLCEKLKFPKISQEMWLFSKFNIFSGESLPIIINNTLEEVKNDLGDFITNKYGVDGELIIKEAFCDLKLSNYSKDNIESEISENKLRESSLLKILDQEKLRLGTPDANLLVENVKFRIENNLWD